MVQSELTNEVGSIQEEQRRRMLMSLLSTHWSMMMNEVREKTIEEHSSTSAHRESERERKNSVGP